MHQTHLRTIDLNLLPVLDALLRHCNATRAGAELGLSQPAMSRALGRLRDLLGDPLLVRGSRGLVPTARAEALRQPLAAVLAGAVALVDAPRFDPAGERRTVRIAMTDAHADVLLAPLIARLSAAAPGIVIEWVPVGPQTVAAVRDGQVDLALALATTPLPRGASSAPLMADRLAVVVRRGHPCGAQWQLADYGRHASVVIALTGDATSDIDAELAAHGITRPIRAVVPSFAAALAIVAATDSVTTISRAFAARHARALGLTCLEPPLAQPVLDVVMAWSAARAGDPLLDWLRGELVATAQA